MGNQFGYNNNHHHYQSSSSSLSSNNNNNSTSNNNNDNDNHLFGSSLSSQPHWTASMETADTVQQPVLTASVLLSDAPPGLFGCFLFVCLF